MSAQLLGPLVGPKWMLLHWPSRCYMMQQHKSSWSFNKPASCARACACVYMLSLIRCLGLTSTEGLSLVFGGTQRQSLLTIRWWWWWWGAEDLMSIEGTDIISRRARVPRGSRFIIAAPVLHGGHASPQHALREIANFFASLIDNQQLHWMA